MLLKRLIVVSIIMLIIVGIESHCIKNNTKYLKGSVTQSQYQIQPQSQIVQPNELLTVVHTVNNNNINTINNCIDKLPKPLIQKFKEMGFRIYLTDKPTYKNTDYVGCFIPEQKKIEIIDEKNITPDVIYHEFGHFLGYILNYSDKTTDFSYIFNKEKKYMNDNRYAQTTSSEFYAESVAVYMLDCNRLKTKFPETYNYINNDIIKIERLN